MEGTVNEEYTNLLGGGFRLAHSFMAEAEFCAVQNDAQKAEILLESCFTAKDERGKAQQAPPVMNRSDLKDGADKAFIIAYREYLNSKDARNNSKTQEVLAARTKEMDHFRKMRYFHDLLFLHSDFTAPFKIIEFDEMPSDCILEVMAEPQADHLKELKREAKSIREIRNSYWGHEEKARVLDQVTFEKALRLFASLTQMFDQNKLSDAGKNYRKELQDFSESWLKRSALPPIPYDEIKRMQGFDEGVFWDFSNQYFDSRSTPQMLYFTERKKIENLFAAQLSVNHDRKQLEQIRAILQEPASAYGTLSELSSSGSGQAVPGNAAQEEKRTGGSEAQEEKRITDGARAEAAIPDYHGGTLDSAQLDDLLGRAIVMADNDFWLKKRDRKFLMNDVAKRLAAKRRCMVVDWCTRVELFRIESNANGQCTEEMIQNAKCAHSHMTLMERAGRLAYMKREEQITSSKTSIVNIIESNPNDFFVVFSVNNHLTEMIREHGLQNVITLRYSDAVGRCTIRTGLPALAKEEGAAASVQPAEPHLPDPDAPLVSRRSAPAPAQPAEPHLPDADSIRTPVPYDRTLLSCARVPKAGDTVYDRNQNRIELGKEIGSGGEGCVYQSSLAGKVVKIYHREQLTRTRKDKLAYMTGHNPGIKELCWPEQLVFNEHKEFVGYTMADVSAYVEFGKSVLKVNSPAVRKTTMQGWNRENLVLLCRNLCRTFIGMHRHDIYMGDVNPRNIMLAPGDKQGKSYVFVDCDSYQAGRYPCPVGTMIFTSPKLYKRAGKTAKELNFETILRNESDEAYAIASLLFHILMLNQSPFAGKNVTNLEEAIRNYNFAYRVTVHGGENKGKVEVNGADTPDGPSRMIWNNTPSYIKDLFAREFKDGGDVPLDTWEKSFTRYWYDIRDGKYTAELEPTRYRDPPDHKFNRDFKCYACGKVENMPKERYDMEERRHLPHLCQYHRTLGYSMRQQKQMFTCIYCGKEYATTAWDAWLLAEGLRKGKKICPACARKEEVVCARCGAKIQMPGWKIRQLRERGQKPLCDSCRKKQFGR